MASTDRRILYVADPMCSWCWGFAPVIVAIAETYGAVAELRLVMGGLRPGTSVPLGVRAKEEIRHHWTEVAARTGQPFDFTFFERDGFVYDTEPSCRAVVAVRNLKPEAALLYLLRVERAFYAEGQDVTDTRVLAELAGDFNIAAEVFEAVFTADEIRDATRSDFGLVEAVGIGGFPAVLLQDPQKVTVLTLGYQPYADLKPALDAWLVG